MDSLGANRPAIDLKTAVRMFRQRKMWMFILYVIGVACVYDVFDQQFATFFKSFFATPEAGTRAFGFATTAGEICNAIIMFSSPWIINRIGAKNTLLIAGMVMAARMIGSSFATTAAEVVALKMLHALEVPFLLVGAFKYITGVFDVRLSATIYLVGFPVRQAGGGDLSLRFRRQYVRSDRLSGYLHDPRRYCPDRHLNIRVYVSG